MPAQPARVGGSSEVVVAAERGGGPDRCDETGRSGRGGRDQTSGRGRRTAEQIHLAVTEVPPYPLLSTPRRMVGENSSDQQRAASRATDRSRARQRAAGATSHDAGGEGSGASAPGPLP
jgi:hypothetical protein